jgi:DNA-binding response OmpR family regulator
LQPRVICFAPELEHSPRGPDVVVEMLRAEFRRERIQELLHGIDKLSATDLGRRIETFAWEVRKNLGAAVSGLRGELKEVSLAPREREILQVLARTPGEWLMTSAIAERLENNPDPRTIGKNLGNLKKQGLIEHKDGLGFRASAEGLGFV